MKVAPLISIVMSILLSAHSARPSRLELSAHPHYVGLNYLRGDSEREVRTSADSFRMAELQDAAAVPVHSPHSIVGHA